LQSWPLPTLQSHPGLRRFSHRLDKVFVKMAFSIAITPLSKNAGGEKYRFHRVGDNCIERTP